MGKLGKYQLDTGIGAYIHDIGKYRYRQNELLRYRHIGSSGIGTTLIVRPSVQYMYIVCMHDRYYYYYYGSVDTKIISKSAAETEF